MTTRPILDTFRDADGIPVQPYFAAFMLERGIDRLTVPQPDNVVPRGMAVQDQLIRDMDADLSDQIDDGNILHFGF